MPFSMLEVFEEFAAAASLGRHRRIERELPFVTGSHAAACRRYRERHALRVRDAERLRRQAHAKEFRAIHTRYRERHRDRIRVRQAEWAAVNAEKRRASALAYYYRNREVVLARQREKKAQRRATHTKGETK